VATLVASLPPPLHQDLLAIYRGKSGEECFQLSFIVDDIASYLDDGKLQ